VRNLGTLRFLTARRYSIVDGTRLARYVVDVAFWPVARLLRRAWDDTWGWWRDHGLGLEVYFALAIPLVAAFSHGERTFWERLVTAATAGVAALVLLVCGIFIRNLVRAPERLRLERIKPPSFVATVDLGPADRLQLAAVELLKAVEEYRPWGEIIGHGPVNDGLADERLRTLNATIKRFGDIGAQATIEDGNRKRRREARHLFARIRSITHESNLDEVKGEIFRFMRQR
jgi:hypothetical protein